MLGGFSEGRIARCHPVSVLTGFDDVELGVASPQACVEVMGVPMNQLLRPSLGDIGGGLLPTVKYHAMKHYDQSVRIRIKSK